MKWGWGCMNKDGILIICGYIGLKTLVSLHQAVNPTDADALTLDEVTIISAVLDLRSKAVSTIMTPIDDVFTLSTEDILNEDVVDKVN